MAGTTFQGFIVRKGADGKPIGAIEQIPREDLPAGEVTVEVAYSTLNYKDGLAVTGAPGVIRSFPLVPGIDFSGTVMDSQSPDYAAGDQVVATGWGLGEKHWGGLAQMARVPSSFLVKLPAGLDLKRSMAIGTAGFTAMQCVLGLERHGLSATAKEVVVTGAVGGVGSIAIAILAKLGYNVVASTGRAGEHNYLYSLGASSVIDRSLLATPSGRPMDAERWAGAVDTVGGETLAGLVRSMLSGASIAACGVAGGPNLATTVFPFILRGVNLLGINSVMVPYAERVEIWRRLAADLPMEKLDSMTTEAGLTDLPELGKLILKGQLKGRTVIKL